MYMNTTIIEELENNILDNDMENTITDLTEKPIEYYLNIDSDGEVNIKSQFRKRAKELGFTGNAIYLDKPSSTFKKFLNKKFKSNYNLKSNPINKDNTVKKKVEKLEKQGATYNQKFNKFLLDKKSFTIDLKGTSSIKNLLDRVLESNQSVIMKFTMTNGNEKVYTINKETAKRLQDTVLYDNQEIEDSSDAEFKNILTSEEMSTVEISMPIKKKPSGAFFKYLHNIQGLDLSQYQIYNDISEITPEQPCCFLQSLIASNQVHISKINRAKQLIQTRDIPACKINDLCIDLQIHIAIQNNTQKQVHYPTGKDDLSIIIREKEPIKIGLLNEHYFYKGKTNITSYAIKHYEDIKHIKDFNKIYKKLGNTYKKSNDRFIDTFSCIRLLLEHKSTLLTPISLCDEIYSTQYYNLFNEITTLDYDEEKNCRLNPYKRKKDLDNCINVFADFETSTDGDKHIPYLCNISCTKKTFYGDECGKKMLQYLVEKNKYTTNEDGEEVEKSRNIRLVFHNAGYDVRFLYKYFWNFTPIERGKFLLRAYGKFTHNGITIKIQIQDSYALIPKPLRDFSKMFNLPVEKEILPYNLYTRENIEKGCVDIPECLIAVGRQFEENNIGKDIDPLEKETFIKDYLKNCKRWRCIINEKIDIIRYSQEYCKMDVAVLEKGYNTFKQSIKDITYSCEQDDLDDELSITNEQYLDIDHYVSIASLALDYMKYKGVFDDVCEVSGNVQTFINKCMYGGRTMTSENKKINNIPNQVLADFDAVSLYPSAMEQLEGYLKGIPKIIENKSYDYLKNLDGYFVEIVIKQVNRKFKFPLMSKLTKEGIRDWTNEMVNETMYVDKTTLEELIKYHKIEFEIIRGYYYDEGRNYKLKKVIQHLFNTRVEAKKAGNPIQEVYKLLMNSAYGKTLLKPIDTDVKFVSNNQYKSFVDMNYNYLKEGTKIDGCNYWKFELIKPINEHFNYVSCGVEVLSTSKRIMNSVMCLAEDLDIDMYYTDTDSIHIDNSKINLLADEYKKINNKELIGSKMGQFHSDFDSNILKGEVLASRSIFLGKKCYIDELVSMDTLDKIDYHIRLKGIPNQSILHYCKQNTITPFELYEKLYDGEEITFDLTCNHMKVNFKFHKDMTISTLDSFDRKIKFK